MFNCLRRSWPMLPMARTIWNLACRWYQCLHTGYKKVVEGYLVPLPSSDARSNFSTPSGAHASCLLQLQALWQGQVCFRTGMWKPFHGFCVIFIHLTFPAFVVQVSSITSSSLTPFGILPSLISFSSLATSVKDFAFLIRSCTLAFSLSFSVIREGFAVPFVTGAT